MSNPGSEKKELIWVRDVGGQPRVRWGRVAGFIASVATVTMLGALLVQAFSEVPFSLAAVLAPQCITLAYTWSWRSTGSGSGCGTETGAAGSA